MFHFDFDIYGYIYQVPILYWYDLSAGYYYLPLFYFIFYPFHSFPFNFFLVLSFGFFLFGIKNTLFLNWKLWIVFASMVAITFWYAFLEGNVDIILFGILIYIWNQKNIQSSKDSLSGSCYLNHQF